MLAFAAVEPTGNSAAPVEEIVVLGKRPGPPLWRVAFGTHRLWIFGTLQPLPKQLEWDASSISAILADSDEFLGPPEISASVSNRFRAVGVLRKLKKLEQLPKGQTLSDVLDAELYRRLMVVRAQYAPGNKKLLRYRAITAADKISTAALRKVGLSQEPKILSKLRKMAKKAKVQITEHKSEVDIDQAILIITDVSPEAGAACLRNTLDAITSDLRGSLLRAQAWAAGDASLLKQFDYPDLEQTCVRNAFNNTAARMLLKQSKAQWLESAERALRQNQQTFAALPVRELIHPEGLLAQLQARGFSVRGQ